MTPESTATEPVTRADIEAKLAEIRGSVDDGADRAKGVGVAIGVVVVAAVVAGAFFLGRRRGHKRRAIIEIQRI